MKAIGPRLFPELCKFGVVGVFGAGLNYLVFWVLLTVCGTHYLVSGAAGFLVPIPFVFMANRRWTFRSDVTFGEGMPLYAFTNLVALVAHSLTQLFVRQLVGIPDVFSQPFGIIASASVNFALARSVVFGRRAAGAASVPKTVRGAVMACIERLNKWRAHGWN